MARSTLPPLDYFQHHRLIHAWNAQNFSTLPPHQRDFFEKVRGFNLHLLQQPNTVDESMAANADDAAKQRAYDEAAQELEFDFSVLESAPPPH